MTDVPSAVAEYIAHGWKLCRIQPGSKGPRDSDWNEPGHEIRVPEAFPLGYGVGLLHAYSNTCAIDIDNYPVARQWLLERGVDIDSLMEADDAVQIRSGRIDSAKLLYACPPRPGASCAPYPGVDRAGKDIKKLALDFRCATAGGNSQQDALPPTIHPGRGLPYEWRFGMFGDWRVLPPLPAALEAIWDELKAPATTALPTVAVPSGAAPERIAAWLKTQDPGMTRTDWVVVGMKLHAEFQGSSEGFKVWQEWSSKSTKWDDEARETMYPIWKGFKLEGRALATLEADIRTMPAEPGEFEIVTNPLPSAPTAETLSPAPAPGELVDAEGATEREVRNLLQDWVVLQTGGGKRYFLMPGHPIASIRSAAGLAGQELGADQLANIFGPYMPLKRVGKQVLKVEAVEEMRNAKWRRSAHRVSFHPGGKEFFAEGDGLTYLNAYKPIPIEPIKPRPHQIEPLLWLLRRVLDDHDQPTGGVFVTWLLRLYAYVLTRPGIKVKWAPILYSKTQGTGKTTLMQTLPSILFGQQYVNSMVHTVLRERFAGAKFDSTWWVCLSEMHSDVGKIDARTIANKLKPWITDDTIQIEKKGVDSYEIKNHLQFTAMSNHADALFIEEGSNDRRWLVGQMLEAPLSVEDKTMLDPLFGGDDVRDPRAVNWLHWFFLNDVDLSGFKATESPPDTMAKSRVREHSRSVWEDEIFETLHINAPPFDKDLMLPTDLTKNLLIGKGVSIAQAKNLLEKAGLRELPRRYDFARSVYCRHNYVQWATASPRAVQQHLRDGVRPFTLPVDDGSDLL